MNDPIGEILSQQFAGIEESDRQMIILALAELSLRRPGWEFCTREIAKKLQGEVMFDQFRKTSTAPHGAILVDYSQPVSDRLRYTAKMREEALEKFCQFIGKASNATGALLVVFRGDDFEVFGTVQDGFKAKAVMTGICAAIEARETEAT